MLRSDETQQKNWNFFRAGGVVQVEIKSADDLKKLDQLDPKHWMALAIPVQGVHLDPRTLKILDTDDDGQVRPPELIAAVQWLSERVRDLGQVIDFKSPSQGSAEGEASLILEQITAPGLLQCAQRILRDLHESGALTLTSEENKQTHISLHLVDHALQLFKDSPLNGDGVIPADASTDPQTQCAIQRVIDTQGHELDRSGKPGMTAGKVESFFAALESRRAWLRDGANIFRPAADKLTHFTREHLDTVNQLYHLHAAFIEMKTPLDNYFDLCQLSRLNPQLANHLEKPSPDTRTLRSILESTPLAAINPDGELMFKGPLNPLWSKAFDTLKASAERLGLWTGGPEGLKQEQWDQFKDSVARVTGWLGQKPSSTIEVLNDLVVFDLLENNTKEKLLNMIQTDLQKARDYEAHADLQKLLLLKRDLLKIVQNFVNFSDFYRHKNAIFQIGTLYLDGRSTDLCLEQLHPTRHGTLDPQSGAFVVYCECTRAKNPPKSIIALITDGEGSQMSVGRAGIFVDKQGNDWSALITKVIANPVSYREAFWSPYRRIVRWIEEQISKKMAAADITTPAELSKVAEKVPAAQDPAKDTKPGNAGTLPAKIDVGTVAALGVALGSIGTFVGVITSKFFDLGILMPFGIIAVGLMISGPSVVLAWFKLKNRNLAPILDANGWAINTRAIINVPFASSLTSLRQVPLSLGSVMPDPYAEKARPWKLYWSVGILGFVFLLWIGGYLDRYLPEKARFGAIMGGSKPTTSATTAP